MVLEFSTSVRRCFKKFATFKGRSSRAEFWWFTLFILVSQMASFWIDDKILSSPGHIGPLASLLIICFSIPFYAVGCRRLHDIGKSGWWLVLSAVPFIGSVILMFWLAKRGEINNNLFGTPQSTIDGDFTKKYTAGEVGILSYPIVENIRSRFVEMSTIKKICLAVSFVVIFGLIIRGSRDADNESDDSPSYSGSSQIQMTTVEYYENKKACYNGIKEALDDCRNEATDNEDRNVCISAYQIAKNECMALYDSHKIQIRDR